MDRGGHKPQGHTSDFRPEAAGSIERKREPGKRYFQMQIEVRTDPIGLR